MKSVQKCVKGEAVEKLAKVSVYTSWVNLEISISELCNILHGYFSKYISDSKNYFHTLTTPSVEALIRKFWGSLVRAISDIQFW